MKQDSTRMESFDYIRGIAVLMVLLSHMSGRGIFKTAYLDFTGLGHVGVYLFFALSSFLLFRGMLSKEFSLGDTASFFIKRIFRILPLYYLVVLTVFLIQEWTGQVWTSYLHILGGFNGLLETLFFIRGDSVFWSIVSEFHFYLLVPLIVWMCQKIPRATKWIIVLCMSINAALYYLYYFKGLNFLEYFSPHKLKNKGMFLDIFLMPALIMITPTLKSFVRNYKGAIRVAFYSLIVLTSVLVCKKIFFLDRSMYNFRYLSLIFSIVFSFFIISQDDKSSGRRVGSSIVCYLGTRGFSIYLLHFPIMQIVNYLNIKQVFKAPLFLIFLILVSEFSYRMIEQKAISLGRRIIDLMKIKRAIRPAVT